MGAYILKRILLMIPTLLGIMLMTFAVIQFVPGGPVEQVIAKMQGTDTDSTGRISGNTGNVSGFVMTIGRCWPKRRSLNVSAAKLTQLMP